MGLPLYRRLPLLAALFVLAPRAAQACAVCGAGDPKNAATYLSMTLVMSAVPLLMIGGLAYWLWRRYS